MAPLCHNGFVAEYLFLERALMTSGCGFPLSASPLVPCCFFQYIFPDSRLIEAFACFHSTSTVFVYLFEMEIHPSRRSTGCLCSKAGLGSEFTPPIFYFFPPFFGCCYGPRGCFFFRNPSWSIPPGTSLIVSIVSPSFFVSPLRKI